MSGPRVRNAAIRYGHAHRKARDRFMADLAANPGRPCPHCGGPMYVSQLLDLAHTPDGSAYLGMSHRGCNRADAQQKQAALERQKRQPPPPPPRSGPTSRPW